MTRPGGSAEMVRSQSPCQRHALPWVMLVGCIGKGKPWFEVENDGPSIEGRVPGVAWKLSAKV